MVDTKLADAIEELHVAQEAGLNPNDSLSDPLGCQKVGKARKPQPEVLGLANFDYL